MNTNQTEFVGRVIHQMSELVNTQDHCAVLWGSRQFGYATDKSDYDINVIHAGSENMRLVVTCENQKYDMTFVPRRTLFRVYSDSNELLQLVPLGKVISTTNGLSQTALDTRKNSPEWRQELLKEVNIDAAAAINPLVGQTPSGTLGLFLRQAYAFMLRESMKGRDLVPLTGVPIRDLAMDIGGPLLDQDVRNVIVYRGVNVLTSERKDAIMRLFDRLMTRNIQPA